MLPTPPAREPATGPGPSRAPGPRGRPAMLVVACALVLAEVAALLAGAVAGVAALVGGADPGPVVFLVVLALGAATLLVAAVRALWAGRRWGRGPVLTAQILVIVTAATWWGAGGGLRAIGPIVVALVVAFAFLSPRVVQVTSGGGAAAS